MYYGLSPGSIWLWDTSGNDVTSCGLKIAKVAEISQNKCGQNSTKQIRWPCLAPFVDMWYCCGSHVAPSAVIPCSMWARCQIWATTILLFRIAFVRLHDTRCKFCFNWATSQFLLSWETVQAQEWELSPQCTRGTSTGGGGKRLLKTG